MAEVETAMKRLTKYMEEYGSLPNLFCTGESEAGTIMRKSGELRQKLRGVYYGIADNWQRIIENKVLRDEVAKHINNYAGLKDTFRKLRLMLKDSPEPVIWHGQKADCARFLQHFGFTDKQANRIFCCVKDGRRLKRLKISSDIGRKGDDSYPIMAILKDYPYNPD